MTAAHQSQPRHPLFGTQEFWKPDPEFPHVEVSNAGKVRVAETRAALPIRGSGGKAFVQIVDKHGRRHDRNVRRLVRKLFGIAPIRLMEPIPAPQPPVLTKARIEQETPVTPHKPQKQNAADAAPQPPAQDWVTLAWPGVKEGHYRISRNGQVVASAAAAEPLRGSLIHSSLGDYLVMNLLRADSNGYVSPYQQVRLDELVAAHFVGPRPGEDYAVTHLDGNRLNNAAENLEWELRGKPVFRRSPVTGPRRKATTLGKRAKRARSLNADPNWRLVTNVKVSPGQYWVSREGKARGVQNIDLKEFLREDGRISVYMKSVDTGNNTTVPLDELVLEAFHGNRPTPRHKPQYHNDDTLDVRADNLYWGIPGQAKPTPEPTPEPAPEPTAVITPTRAEIKVITQSAVYELNGVQVQVNNGKIEVLSTTDDVDSLVAILDAIKASRE